MFPLGLFAEGRVVAAGGPDEQIEGPVWLGALIAHLRQLPVQQLPVLVIGRQVRQLVGAAGNGQLDQRGRAHMAAGPGRPGDGVVHRLVVLHKVRHADIADALAGQGQGLGIGVAHDGIAVHRGDEGHLHAAVYQLPVRLVGDDVDGVAVLRPLALQQPGQALQGLPGIHHAGGIVG